MRMDPKLLSFGRFLLFAAADHFRTGDIAVLVDEVEISAMLLDADLGNLLGGSALLCSPGHLGAGNVPVLVDEVKVPLFLLDANFRDFLSLVSVPPCCWFIRLSFPHS